MSSTINTKTADGLFEFCDYMVEKGYATSNAMDAWKTATRKILSTVHGESYGETDLTNIEFEDLLQRFETLTLSDYKPDSRVAYARRMKNAVEAYLEFVETGQPPKLRRPTRTASGQKPNGQTHPEQTPAAPPRRQPAGELIEFPFPLQTGEMARLHLPRRLRSEDATRLSAFIRTLQLEPQKELPERTGEEAKAA